MDSTPELQRDRAQMAGRVREVRVDVCCVNARVCVPPPPQLCVCVGGCAYMNTCIRKAEGSVCQAEGSADSPFLSVSTGLPLHAEICLSSSAQTSPVGSFGV